MRLDGPQAAPQPDSRAGRRAARKRHLDEPAASDGSGFDTDAAFAALDAAAGASLRTPFPPSALPSALARAIEGIALADRPITLLAECARLAGPAGTAEIELAIRHEAVIAREGGDQRGIALGRLLALHAAMVATGVGIFAHCADLAAREAEAAAGQVSVDETRWVCAVCDHVRQQHKPLAAAFGAA